MSWKDATSWKNAVRNPIMADDIIEGFVKGNDRLKMYWVNRAGHMVRAYTKHFHFSLSLSHTASCIYCNIVSRERFPDLIHREERIVSSKRYAR